MIGITGISTSDRLGTDALSSIAHGLTAALAATPLPAGGDERCWWRLLATDEYDAWLIHWPTGGSVRPHDHGGSAGAFEVIEGELTEVTMDGSHTEVAVIPAGVTRTVDAGAVHDVVNLAERASFSVHVYSPPLTSMVFYDERGRDATSIEQVADEAPIWPTDMFGSRD